VRITNGNSKLMIFGYVLLVTILSQMIQAPVVAFGIVAPLAVATAESMGISSSKISMPIGIAAVATCCTLPIGAGATIAAEFNGYLESYGYQKYVVGQLDPMIGRLPMLIITILYCAFLAPKFAPDKPLLPPIYDVKQQAKKEPLNPVAEWAGIIIFFADAIALIFSSKIGLPTWEICLIGAVLMVLFGTLKAKEAVEAVPLSILFTVVGALALSGALSATGAGDLIGSWVGNMVTVFNGNSYLVGLVFFLLPFIMTQFMLNRGTMLIFHPIAIATCASIGGNPIGLMILIQAACLTAYMTPMANGTVPYIMAYGGYTQKSMLKQGWLFAIITCVVSVGWTMTVFPIL
jgi:di/tricarboxylate transporter